MHQHENLGMVFDDDEAIADFLADPDPQFSNLRTHISLLRRFESALVLTLDELMAMIEAQFAGFQLDTSAQDRVSQVFGGTIRGKLWESVPVPLFSNNMRLQLHDCLADIMGTGSGAYRFRVALARQQAYQRAVAGKDSDLEPIRVTYPGPSRVWRQLQREEDAVAGVLIPDDPAVAAIPIVLDQRQFLHFSEPWKPSKGSMGSIYVEDVTVKVRCGCHRTLQKPLANRSQPLDVIAAGSSEPGARDATQQREAAR